MLYRLESGKIQTRAIEFSAADQCNLRCSGCSHMSPFLGPRVPLESELERDFGRLATAMFAGDIRIVGGEPLLNPRIIPILKAAKGSGIAAKVSLTTNGLLLHTMPKEFWDNVDVVRLSLYPGARPSERLVDLARKRAGESGTQSLVSEYQSFRVALVTEPHPADAVTTMIFRTCKNAHLYHCHMVHQGWLYKCSCPAFLTEYLKGMGQSGYRPQLDGFDIHGATDLPGQLWEFLTGSRPLEACRYCLGYVGNTQVHHQLSGKDVATHLRSQPITRKTHLNWGTLAKASLDYIARRAKERLTGKGRW